MVPPNGGVLWGGDGCVVVGISVLESAFWHSVDPTPWWSTACACPRAVSSTFQPSAFVRSNPRWLDAMTLEVFSNLKDSVILPDFTPSLGVYRRMQKEALPNLSWLL